MRYFLDLPDPHNPEGTWVNIMSGTKQQVLTFAKNHFGADDDGNINLISEEGDEDEEVEDDI